jgi:hypothetical protein
MDKLKVCWFGMTGYPSPKRGPQRMPPRIKHGDAGMCSSTSKSFSYRSQCIIAREPSFGLIASIIPILLAMTGWSGLFSAKKGDLTRLRRGPLIGVTGELERPPSRYSNRLKEVAMLQAKAFL